MFSEEKLRCFTALFYTYLKKPRFEIGIDQYVETVQFETIGRVRYARTLAGQREADQDGYFLPQQPIVDAGLAYVLPELLERPLAPCVKRRANQFCEIPIII